MPKFQVQIYGKVPEEIEVEAENRDEAEEKALMAVIEKLSFKATLIRETEKQPR